MARLVIFANGNVPNLEYARQLIRPGDTLYAVDGGTRHALALGLLPSVIIGDLDSLALDQQQRLVSQGVEIRQFPRDKDYTDLELALHSAIEAGYREICIIGALGGRLDQTLGNLSLLTSPEMAGLDIRIDDGLEEACFTRNLCEIHGKPGDIVSLIPWGGDVRGISTDGLGWPLDNEELYSSQTRGISNEMLNDIATIKIISGLLLCIHRREG
jgi:thiamine pyrophosphokinase